MSDQKYKLIKHENCANSPTRKHKMFKIVNPKTKELIKSQLPEMDGIIWRCAYCGKVKSTN